MKPLNQDAINFLSTSIDQGRPIPGQSLTNSKDSPNNWERPPEFTNIDDGIHYIFNTIYNPETAGNILLSLNNGVGVIYLASIVLYTGFLEGKWNPDLMILLSEPTMFMVMALADKAEIPYEFESGGDEVTELSPEEQNKRLQEGVNYFDQLHQKDLNKINEQVVPEEIRESIADVQLPPSLLEKVKLSKNENSLLSREK